MGGGSNTQCRQLRSHTSVGKENVLQWHVPLEVPLPRWHLQAPYARGGWGGILDGFWHALLYRGSSMKRGGCMKNG